MKPVVSTLRVGAASLKGRVTPPYNNLREQGLGFLFYDIPFESVFPGLEFSWHSVSSEE
jgi:hypothetical protein